MKILVIRHAIAEDREEFERTGLGDDLRPLTPRGRQKMKGVVRGLRVVVPTIDLIATSPFVRASQTAEIVTRAYRGLKLRRVRHLEPEGSMRAVLKWLQKHKGSKTAALVGHEPYLGVFVSWLLSGLQKSFVGFKKGGACLVELDGSMRPGRAKLLWSLSPAQLREIGGR